MKQLEAVEKMIDDEILFQEENYRNEITIGVLSNLKIRLTTLTPTSND